MTNDRYFVYLLASRRNGTLYVGVTSDLLRRTLEHKQSEQEGFTRRYRVHHLVWYESTPDPQAAILREKQIKKWRRAWKIAMIEKSNPTWRDLSEEFN